MASSVSYSFHVSNLRSHFLGNGNAISVSNIPCTRTRFLTKAVECKESRIGKRPIQVPSTVSLKLEGQNLKVKDNIVVGVSKGFEKKLQMVGVGYRAMLEGNDLVLNLGFSHPVKMTIPDGIKVKVEENTRITISGYDKSSIGQFAATIRKWRPPEPYKGKGIKYADEVIRRKEGKAGKKK